MNDNSFNIYCDESCHLENDKQTAMLLGCVWCPASEARPLSFELREIMHKYNAAGELKWTKVSPARRDFYIELIDWFLSKQDLHFRALVITNKNLLNHDKFNHGSHDIFYYKSYFSLLNKVMSPNEKYNIYLDIKDTRSRFKVRELRNVLCNNAYDFTRQMIKHIQNIHSYESVIMQLADFLLGIVSYKHRYLKTSKTKISLIEYLEEKLGYSLNNSTSLQQSKFNLFVFSPRDN